MMEILVSIMVKTIESKVIFSSDLLHICMNYEVNITKLEPINTRIFNSIKNIVINILAHTESKRDWYWLQNYLITSSIWFDFSRYNKIKGKNELLIF